ncbi:hypothetical protein [Desulfogranum marinum]|uniref:hypothetical protein n=1 Tax=Desulfogranum marinum TaxID=453220 RepID=UPI0019648BEA|nr:hypothetical protein [Desulfogranum marinum]MBM9514796.1 hypothetical protein [Desulfogranum marinum]
MQTAHVIHPVTVSESHELVSDQLLNEVHGEVLFIRTAHATTICKRTAGNMRQQVLTWISEAGSPNASFLTGKMSDKGGRFQVVTRDQAIELFGRWIFKEATA